MCSFLFKVEEINFKHYMNHSKYAITVYSTLYNNRSFSLYYFKIQSNLQKLLENGDWSSSHAIPRVSLEEGAPGVFWWSAPCWPEELADGQPRMPLEVSGSGKGGMGNSSGSCAIKVDLDSLRKFSVLLPEANHLWRSREGPGGHVDDCGSAGYCDCVSKHIPLQPFQSYPSAFSLLYPPRP